MRYKLDRKRKIVDFYIKDEHGREHTEALSFKEVEELIENILWEIRNPMEEEEVGK